MIDSFTSVMIDDEETFIMITLHNRREINTGGVEV